MERSEQRRVIALIDWQGAVINSGSPGEQRQNSSSSTALLGQRAERALRFVETRIAEWSASTIADAERVYVDLRIYAGWRTKSRPSHWLHGMEQALRTYGAQVRRTDSDPRVVYPPARMSVALGDSLAGRPERIGSGPHFLDTWREVSCKCRGCNFLYKQICPEKYIVDFKKESTKNCKIYGEKQVDTAIVADCLLIAAKEEFDYIVTVSGDDDILPGVVGARGLGAAAFMINYQPKRHIHASQFHELIFPSDLFPATV
ncbi:MAG: hypothetical protein AAFN79_03495 [Pseudomonadota bacterium]